MNHLERLVKAILLKKRFEAALPWLPKTRFAINTYSNVEAITSSLLIDWVPAMAAVLIGGLCGGLGFLGCVMVRENLSEAPGAGGNI